MVQRVNSPLVSLRYLDPASLVTSFHTVFPDGINKLGRANHYALGLLLFYRFISGWWGSTSCRQLVGASISVTLELLDDGVDTSIKSKDRACILSIENQIAAGEEDLARSRHSGGCGGVDGHQFDDTDNRLADLEAHGLVYFFAGRSCGGPR